MSDLRFAEIMPPLAPAQRDATRDATASDGASGADARALVSRLVRCGAVPPDLLALVEGPSADAVAKAADYAAQAISPGTIATYKADWADFAGWARAQGVNPAALPVHPVVVAAWLATLAPELVSGDT